MRSYALVSTPKPGATGRKPGGNPRAGPSFQPSKPERLSNHTRTIKPAHALRPLPLTRNRRRLSTFVSLTHSPPPPPAQRPPRDSDGQQVGQARGVPAVRGDGRRHRHLRLQPPPQHHRQPRSQGQQDGEGSGSA
ncbi:hypothetical protein VPH35_128279 [Triticum aestivum]